MRKMIFAAAIAAATLSAPAVGQVGNSQGLVNVTVQDVTLLNNFLNDTQIAAHRARALSPDHPVLRGSAQNPDVFFQNREAIWSWTELYRNVEGCKTAYILYDTVYEIPSIGFRQNARVGVTYTHNGNGWLAVADQSTRLP